MNPPANKRLRELELIIQEGLETFVEVGNALLEIRKDKLYEGQFDTFEDYCRMRWQMGLRQAQRSIKAAEIAENLRPMGRVQPIHERQLRPLTSLDIEDQREVWRQATDLMPEPTAKLVETIARAISDARRDVGVNHQLAISYQPTAKDIKIHEDGRRAIRFLGPICQLAKIEDFDPEFLANRDYEELVVWQVESAERVIVMAKAYIKAAKLKFPHVFT